MMGEESVVEKNRNEDPIASVAVIDGAVAAVPSAKKKCSWLDFHGVAEAKGYAYVGFE